MKFNKRILQDYELVEQLEEQRVRHENLQPLVDPSPTYSPDDDSLDDEETRSSIDSESSGLFQDIENFAENNYQTPDDFYGNVIFQKVWQNYVGVKGISKRSFSLAVGVCVIIWLLGVGMYAREAAKHTQSLALKLGRPKTTIVSSSNGNVTINKYDPSLKNITLDEYMKGTFLPYTVPVNWLNAKQYPQHHNEKEGLGGAYYMTRGEKESFVMKQIHNPKPQTFIDNPQFAFENNFYYIQHVYLNPARPIDQLTSNWHIVATDVEEQWRHLSFALYWIFNPLTKDYTPIQPPKSDLLSEDSQSRFAPKHMYKLHFAEFSPLGTQILYGFNHNLYILHLESGEITTVTNTGSRNIFNGKPDWIYEEEVISDYKLFWWSPDQKNLVFVQLNDTEVPEVDLDYYIKDNSEIANTFEEPTQRKTNDVNQYPVKTTIKYPKPGTPNPKITVFNYNLKEGKLNDITNMDTKNIGDEAIVYDGIWIDNKSFLMKLSDRTSKILCKRVFTGTGKLETISTIDTFNSFHGWVEKTSPLAIVPVAENGDENHYNGYIDKHVINNKTHLCFFKDASTSEITTILTPQDVDWEVRSDSPITYNKVQNVVYFLTTMNSNMDAHLVSLDIKTKKIKTITGIDKSGKYETFFSNDGQYLNLFYQGPLQPWQKLINMEDLHENWAENENEIDADALIESYKPINFVDVTAKNLQAVNLPTRLYRQVQIGKGSNKVIINMIEILPPNFNPEKNTYPLLVYAYGGPGSQSADKNSAMTFQEVVSSCLNAVVLIIDPRGTGPNWSLKSFARGNLGYWEPRDIITVTTEYIEVNKKFIKSERIAIWGWSYGGFTALKTLEVDKGEIFKYGMAVAPVTNWMFYDSIYTERYMSKPDENENYLTTAIIKEPINLKYSKRFLVMHGTSDDNVHIQNLYWLLDKLNLHKVENYDLHFFPDSDHTISFHGANSVVFDKLLHWLGEAFDGKFDQFL